MLFSGRAYYNLLWLEKLRGNTIPAKGFEILDYRKLSLAELFINLENLNIFFNEVTFSRYCEDLDSPEELIESLGLDDGDEKREGYLLCFELWRRLLPEKECVSIFCDELDRIIAKYEKDRDDEELLQTLHHLIDILDRNTVTSDSAHEIFNRLSMYIAHDLENVIFTYIDTMITDGLEDEYLALLDHFMPYVSDKRNLQFLKLKTLSNDFEEEKENLSGFLVSSLTEDLNFPLSLHLLFYLTEMRNDELFSELFATLASSTKEEDSLVALLDVLVEYHRKRGREEKEKQVTRFLQNHLGDSGKKVRVTPSKVLALL